MTHDELIKLLQEAYEYITEYGEPDVTDSYRMHTAYDEITEKLDEAIQEEALRKVA
jgi:hypothetical protein